MKFIDDISEPLTRNLDVAVSLNLSQQTGLLMCYVVKSLP